MKNKYLRVIRPSGEHENEGTRKIGRVLEREFEKQKIKAKKDLLIVGGFFDIFKALKYKDNKNFCLNIVSNQKFSSYMMLKSSIEDLRIRREIKRINNVFLSLFSSCIPLFIKKSPVKNFPTVIVPTKYLKRELGNSRNIKIVSLGIDVNKFRPSKKKGLGVAFFSAPAGAKGYKDFYDAIDYVKIQQKFKFYFSLRIEKMKEILTKPNVLIMDKPKNIVDAYNENNIIVMPFRTANSAIGVPLTLIEAMACGKAVITTDLPHIKEICGNSVLYVKPNSPKDLAKKIDLLTKDKKLCKNLGKKARKRVEKKYSQDKMIEDYKKVLS